MLHFRSRKYYFKTFVQFLRQCKSIESIEHLLREGLRENFMTARRPENEQEEKQSEDDMTSTLETLAIHKENINENKRHIETDIHTADATIVADEEINTTKKTITRPALAVI